MRERLQKIINCYIEDDKLSSKPCELVDFLIANGVIALPYSVKVGQQIYTPFYDDEDKLWDVDCDEITDVCTKGMYVSDIEGLPNNGVLIPWSEVGEMVFFDAEAAKEKCREEMKNK